MRLVYLCMSTIIAIDYGEKRTGLAITDSKQIIASSLRTVNTHLVIDFLDEYVKNENIEKFVIGLPKQKDNSNSFIEVKIKKFILKLKAKFPLIQIDRYDERFTSKIAFKAILDSGIGRIKRRDKGLIDSVSATILLQSYLEYKKNNQL